MSHPFLRNLAEQLNLFDWPANPLPPLASLPPSTPLTAGTTYLQLGPRQVPYQLRRRPRARLTLVIADHGLRINAPATLPLREIELFAREHAAWILRKLDEQAAAPRPQQVVVADGVRLPLLNGEAQIRVLPGHNRTRWIGDTLLIEARPRARINGLAQRALQRRALDHFAQRLAHFAPLLRVEVPPLGLSSARTRWGSCSSLSGIRLNWRLIHLPPDLGDYVVIHELAHLHEMNHSKRFWAIVERACPDWRERRTQLRVAARTLPLV